MSSKRKKSCQYRVNPDIEVSYKNVDRLKAHITEGAGSKIVPSRISGTSAKYQRQITKSIKIARYLALLPYCDTHRKG